jgi:hypothetical protein
MTKTKVVKPNLKFIHRLQARLRENPAAYNQGSYAPAEWECAENVCGTPVCIAGHAYLMTGKTMKQLQKADSDEIVGVASKAMGFTEPQTDKLFGSGDHWPKPFHFDTDESQKKKVEKACKYLDAMVEGVTLFAKKPYLNDLWY